MIKDFINNIKSYSHDENLYPFKRDLVNEIKKGNTMLRHTSSVVRQRPTR